MKLGIGAIRWLTFDCYGTLIDWESGILDAVQSPDLPLPVRIGRRLGLSEPSAILLGAAASLRTAWISSAFVALGFAVAAEYLSDGSALAPFLLVAPLVPVLGVAAAYGPHEDPLESLIVTAPFGRTRLILLNTPHNPTGGVLTRAELEAVARVAVAHDLVVLTDEVYEHLTYDGAQHVPVATEPGMAGRTLTVSSAGKTFSFTGWKVGWVTGPAELVEAVLTVKQFLTFVNAAPLQPAVAFALRDDEAQAWVRELAASLRHRRDLLVSGLQAAGFDVVVPRGTYFVLADAAPLGYDDGARLARELPTLAGVVGVPATAFTHEASVTAGALASWLRFTFVKREDVLHEAVGRLARLATTRP